MILVGVMGYDVVVVKVVIVLSGLLIFDFVVIVWDSVWIFCGFDLCGGVNGVCICLVF